jgi:hypothetical protein
VTVVDGVVAGGDREITLCSSNDMEYVLLDFLVDTNADGEGDGAGDGALLPGNLDLFGTWSYWGNVPTHITSNEIDPDQDTFNPNGLDDGKYQYTYTVNRGNDGVVNPGELTGSCNNCEASATVTINISSAPFAGVDSSITVCNNPG